MNEETPIDHNPNRITMRGLYGSPFCEKYPPDFSCCKNEFRGYASANHKAILYLFLVCRDDLAFSYHGKRYYFLVEDFYVARCDENFKEEYEKFPSGLAMIETFEIERKKLVDIIGELEDVVCKPYDDGTAGYDLAGNIFNKKYPPDFARYGNDFSGYATWNREAIFYQFIIQNYDLEFSYHGKKYYFVTCHRHVALSDEHFTEEYEIFPNGNVMVETFEIEGKKLIDIIDDLEDVESV